MDFSLSTISSGSTVLDEATCQLLSLVLSPTLSRSRKRPSVIMRARIQSTANNTTNEEDDSFSPRGSSLSLSKNAKLPKEDNDDDTASTVSSTSVEDEEEEEDEADVSCLSLSCSSASLSSITSSSSERRRVSFAHPLVTAIHYRPLCTEDDKYYLHYSEHDYIDFKLDYLTKGNSPLVRKTPRKVGFARDVVTSTHTVLGMQERQQLPLYYNEEELQQFLDDFVASLQQQHYGR
jgi:hypothetical protein